MNRLGICFLLCCFFLAPLSRAQDALNPEKSLGVAAENFGLIDHFSPLESPREASRPTTHLRLRQLDPNVRWSDISAEPFCATMRTYRVRREYRNSDVVSPEGYTTCVPSKRWEMRSAVQLQGERAPE